MYIYIKKNIKKIFLKRKLSLSIFYFQSFLLQVIFHYSAGAGDSYGFGYSTGAFSLSVSFLLLAFVSVLFSTF